jgi:hypothetical protein
VPSDNTSPRRFLYGQRHHHKELTCIEVNVLRREMYHVHLFFLHVDADVSFSFLFFLKCTCRDVFVSKKKCR